jgi:hypothetical protein
MMSSIIPADILRYFDFSQITFLSVLETFSGMITGFAVAAIFYFAYLKQFDYIKLKTVLIIGGLTAFFEKTVLDLLDFNIVYWELPGYYFTVVINAALISFLSVFIYWQVMSD